MFKRQDGYVVKKIAGKSYLLPYGQIIADQQRGFLLNETSEFFLKLFEKPQEEQFIIEQFIKQFDLKEVSEKDLRRDAKEFIEQLHQLGVLREIPHRIKQPYYKTMKIGALLFHFYGPADAFSEHFNDFYCDDDCEKLTNEATQGENKVKEATTDGTAARNEMNNEMNIELIPSPPFRHPNGLVLLRNDELIVHEWEDGYIFFFPTLKNIHEARMSKDGTLVRIYCQNWFDDTNRENLFHAIRHFFLFYAQQHGYFAIHSASILHEGKAWLFSGHSGMGKSTHTALWHELFGTPYINGDLNLLARREDGTIEVHGIPWCGTSGIYSTKTYELGGIVLLGRSSKDFVTSLPLHDKILKVMQRMISPTWTIDLLDKDLAFAEVIANTVPVWKLSCTKEASAAYTMRDWIEKNA